MPWPDAGADPFPSPRRQEPAGLRRDILDELADHLAFAAEDETEKHGLDGQQAWARAVARFGNPDALARRLWWDAMKERIMRDWIQTGIVAVCALSVVVMAVFLVKNIRQMQTMQITQAELLKAVQGISERQQPESANLSLDVEVRRGTLDGPPAQGVRVTLSGSLTPNNKVNVSLETDASGRVKFQPVPQGSYEISLEDPQSRMALKLSHSLFAGKGSNVRVVAPAFSPVETRFAIEPSLPFRDERVLVFATFNAEAKAGEFTWNRHGTLLAGRAGVYAMTSRGYQPPTSASSPFERVFYNQEIGPPQATVKMPPYKVQVTLIQPAYSVGPAKPGQEFVLITVHDSEKRSALVELKPQEANPVIMLKLSEKQCASAERIMKEYSIASRWKKRSLMDERYGNMITVSAELMTHNTYVVEAIPLTDGTAVECLTVDGKKVTLEARESIKDDNASYAGGPDALTPESVLFSGRVRRHSAEEPSEDIHSALREGEHLVAFRLPNAVTLARSYPAECRFLLFCVSKDHDQKGSVVPWRGAATQAGIVTPPAWFADQNSHIEVETGDAMPWDFKSLSVEVTDIMRGAEGTTPPDGLLVQFSAPNAVAVSVDDETNGWYRPHLLVVSDTPPDDL